MNRSADPLKHIGQSVTVELYGLAADSVRNNRAHKVKATTSNTSSFYVQFYDPTGFSFKKIIMPELATLAFTVNDEQGKIHGRRFLPISDMRPGYRFITLKNESNQPLNMNAVFVHVTIKDYVPEYFEDFANALVDPINYVASQSKKEEMLHILCDEQEVSKYLKEGDVFVKPDVSKNTSLDRHPAPLMPIHEVGDNTEGSNQVSLSNQVSIDDAMMQIVVKDRQRGRVASSISDQFLQNNNMDSDLEIEWKKKLGKVLKEIDSKK